MFIHFAAYCGNKVFWIIFTHGLFFLSMIISTVRIMAKGLRF